MQLVGRKISAETLSVPVVRVVFWRHWLRHDVMNTSGEGGVLTSLVTSWRHEYQWRWRCFDVTGDVMTSWLVIKLATFPSSSMEVRNRTCFLRETVGQKAAVAEQRQQLPRNAESPVPLTLKQALGPTQPPSSTCGPFPEVSVAENLNTEILPIYCPACQSLPRR